MAFDGVDHGDLWCNLLVRTDPETGTLLPFLIDWESLGTQYVPIRIHDGVGQPRTADGYNGVTDHHYLRDVIKGMKIKEANLQQQLVSLLTQNETPTQTAAASSMAAVHPGSLPGPAMFQNVMRLLRNLSPQFPRLNEVPLSNFRREVYTSQGREIQFSF